MPVEHRARSIAIGGVCECVALTKRTAHRPELTRLNLGLDAAGQLVYLAPTRVNLQLAEERAPGVAFLATREHAHSVAVD